VSWPARVDRLTAGGADLVVPCSFEPGSLLNLQFTSTRSAFSCNALACVVYSSYQSANECLVGCTFASELGPDELEALL